MQLLGAGQSQQRIQHGTTEAAEMNSWLVGDPQVQMPTYGDNTRVQCTVGVGGIHK